MRYIGFLAMALAGLTVGMFLGIAVHGFTNPVATLVFALCGAALLLFIQLPLHISNNAPVTRLGRVLNISPKFLDSSRRVPFQNDLRNTRITWPIQARFQNANQI